jgi:hypothetical protein
MNMLNDPAPLESAEFEAQQLMAEHPPVLRDRNKTVVFDVACPAGCTHGGKLAYTRWPAFALPAQCSLADAMQRVSVSQDIYDYSPTTGVAGAVEWHVNFADPNLFVAYGGGLFAQDEMQVAEHPALGALKEALVARKWPARTVEDRKPTPVLVRGVERRCHVATDVNIAEGRPSGLYGNAFMAAPADAVRRATHRLEPPTITNLIAMAAPVGGVGRYGAGEIALILTTAFSGFRAAVLESGGAPAVVHTGYWGCGAFGGNRELMSLLQIVAARAAGVERVVFHTVTAGGRAEFDLAVERIGRLSEANDVAAEELIARTLSMGLRWGQSDGN